MSRKTIVIFSSVIIVVLVILTIVLSMNGGSTSKLEKPFHIVLPVHNQLSQRPAVADAVQSAPKRGAGMSYADDISDAHDPTLAPDFNPGTLHGKIRSEPRDEAWASRSEDILSSVIADSLFDRPGTDVRINCASSLCEARGLMRAAQGSAEVRSAIERLQNGETVNRLALNGQAFITISTAKRPDGVAFFLYSRRID